MDTSPLLGNRKLAVRDREILAETRGQGGYIIALLSLHASGKIYTLLSGNLGAIPTLDPGTGEALLAATRTLGPTELHPVHLAPEGGGGGGGRGRGGRRGGSGGEGDEGEEGGEVRDGGDGGGDESGGDEGGGNKGGGRRESVIIAFIGIPALAWVQATPEQWVEHIRQAHLVHRLKIQHAADIAILKTTLLRAQQKTAAGIANLMPAERQELVDTLRALFEGQNETLRAIAGTFRNVADIELTFRTGNEDDLSQTFAYVTDELERTARQVQMTPDHALELPNYHVVATAAPPSSTTYSNASGRVPNHMATHGNAPQHMTLHSPTPLSMALPKRNSAQPRASSNSLRR